MLSMIAACGDDDGVMDASTMDARTMDAHDEDADDVDSGPSTALSFTRHQLTDQFFAEGAAFADFDHDGEVDIVSGPFIYRGPSYSQTRRFKAGGSFDVHGYSDNFFAFVHDFNDDGWDDFLIVAFPGDHATWYQNPEGRDELWTAHRVFEEVDNESPAFEDITGDGVPELICNHLGDLGFATFDPDDATQPWTFHVIAEGTWSKFTHGLGVGDVNGDGRKDVLLATGVWQQPANIDDPWPAHAALLASPNLGGAQMHVNDVDGDGDADVITTLEAHGYGVAWFEQTSAFTFSQHVISGTPQATGPAGVALHEPHSLTLADMDGDGDQDIVTGERHWAHIPQDGLGFEGPALLVWFERDLVVADGTVRPAFIAHIIDDDSGVGTQVMTGDVNGDQHADVIVANKKGAFVFTQD